MKPLFLLKAAGMYTTTHFIYISIYLVLFIIGLILIQKYGKDKICNITLVISIIVTAAEIYKIAYTHYRDYIIMGYGKTVLTRWIPLSFCSLFIYGSWLSVSKNSMLHKIGSTFLVSGALFAGLAFLIYPSTAIGDWPWWHFYSIHGMSYHALMFFTGLINLIYGDTKPIIKNFKYYAIFTYFFIAIALIIYYTTGESFMFLGVPYALPKIIHDIYNINHFLYTLIVILGYSSLYFISVILYKIFIKIKGGK